MGQPGATVGQLGCVWGSWMVLIWVSRVVFHGTIMDVVYLEKSPKHQLMGHERRLHHHTEARRRSSRPHRSLLLTVCGACLAFGKNDMGQLGLGKGPQMSGRSLVVWGFG